jgi:nucleoside 2-deoxyribosyltransferase
MKKVYLAGPDVFKPRAKMIGETLKRALARHNLEGLFPLDNEIDLVDSPYENGKKIALANMDMIRSCDAVLANLKPFRGPSADVGTVWECAFAKGLGKIVVGYEYEIEYKHNVIGKVPHDGMAVEDFNVWDNIMLVHGLDGAARDWHEAMCLVADLLKESE